MIDNITQFLKSQLQCDFIRFGIIGTAGFLTNFCILSALLIEVRLPIAAADLLAAELSLWVTFACNDMWTFRGQHRYRFWPKVGRYHAYNWIGLGINTALVFVLVRYIGLYYGIALVVGSLTALLFNYFFNKKLVFASD